ncbi:MAG: NUDIX domain-containing protein [Actinobacteria bacterium]|nr:NUDIX domain-containing protein [Actinomycetota bacterium]
MSQHSPFDYSSHVLASLPRHSVSVAGIVINSTGQVLAIRRRDNGQWQPPGGVLETDETFEQGVCREVTEETGAQVAVERLTGLYKNVKAGVVATVFRCRPLTEPAAETTEAAEVAWLDPADVPHLMTPAFAARVLDAFEATPQVRTHDGTRLLS